MRFSPLYFVIFILLCIPTTAYTKTVNIMGPLWLSSENEWTQFENNLNTVKMSGVSAISIDVWWGEVEKSGDQKFNWAYYDKVFTLIMDAGLNIVPIMSFHQCGGNVGDSCNIPIPTWIWTHFTDTEPTDLMYKSEQGNYSTEYVSLWADALVIKQYRDFMQAFATQYSDIAHRFDEINISMGPAGELRYPSYNQHDVGTNYPTRGAFQSYGDKATHDFQRYLASHYPSLSSLNNAWHTHYDHFSDIMLPSNMSHFIDSGAMKQTPFGRDFLTWYHQSLLAHANRKLTVAHSVFVGTYQPIEIGYKVAGVHWLMAGPNHKNRTAEFAAGVVSIAEIQGENTSLGYSKIINLAAEHSNEARKTVVHFTCLEMANYPKAPSYSKAKDLVTAIGNEAHKQGVTLKGENALAEGVLSPQGWRNIEEALASGHYDGVTILRLAVAVETLPLARIASLTQQAH